MKANEVRLGNLHYYFIDDPINDPATYMVHGYIEHYDFELMELSPDSNDYHPIPLTEEWLLKLGFVKRGIYYHFPHHDIFKLEQYKKKNAYWLRYHSESIDCVRINYVHSLQNLYFALTGMELEYTESQQ